MTKRQQFEDPLKNIDPIMEEAYSISESISKETPLLEDDEQNEQAKQASNDSVSLGEHSEEDREEDAGSVERHDEVETATEADLETSLEEETPPPVENAIEESNEENNEEEREDDIEKEMDALEYDVSDIEFPSLTEVKGKDVTPSLFNNIPIGVSVELGRSQISLKEVFELTEGAVIELDRLVGEPLDLLVNGQIIAQGEVVAIDNNYGLRVTNIISKIQ